jgi:hypothetical protein
LKRTSTRCPPRKCSRCPGRVRAVYASPHWKRPRA